MLLVSESAKEKKPTHTQKPSLSLSLSIAYLSIIHSPFYSTPRIGGRWMYTRIGPSAATFSSEHYR